jgi:hypothetical protein
MIIKGRCVTEIRPLIQHIAKRVAFVEITDEKIIHPTSSKENGWIIFMAL